MYLCHDYVHLQHAWLKVKVTLLLALFWKSGSKKGTASAVRNWSDNIYLQRKRAEALHHTTKATYAFI